ASTQCVANCGILPLALLLPIRPAQQQPVSIQEDEVVLQPPRKVPVPRLPGSSLAEEPEGRSLSCREGELRVRAERQPGILRWRPGDHRERTLPGKSVPAAPPAATFRHLFPASAFPSTRA